MKVTRQFIFIFSKTKNAGLKFGQTDMLVLLERPRTYKRKPNSTSAAALLSPSQTLGFYPTLSGMHLSRIHIFILYSFSSLEF